ncbi:hypothetical protein FJT64_014142 [Amphibalanus amphitrite]|uniref:Uncharacterized protein n=1 Tax=Amphibalanus amphitrite TaxID=1232801 RepID=A0A6A4V9Z3_AMPAM|nr:hypothetical protein FJT64_014142 [Amphibalanus amphitrite]
MVRSGFGSHQPFAIDRSVHLGHQGSQKVRRDGVPLLGWEPYFCVLLQDEQTLTAYRSEEMAADGQRCRPRHDTCQKASRPSGSDHALGGGSTKHQAYSGYSLDGS